MRVVYLEIPFPHIIIHDLYEPQELAIITLELEYYKLSNSLKDATQSGSATDSEEGYLKNNLAKFLEETWTNREDSSILKLNRKIFSEEVKKSAEKHHSLRPLYTSNNDTTLVSYYESSHYYKPHWDNSVLTAVTHLFLKPKSYTGGDLYFPEFDYLIEDEFNRCIIFPSSIMHQVNEVNAEPGFGRWTISQFINYKT